MFDFELPPRLIAQHPLPQRDQSRLMVIRRADAKISHHVFSDLPKLLEPKDLLVLNDTRVLPARLLGRRERTGGKWEGLFLRSQADGAWEMLSKTRGRLLKGETIVVEGGLRLRLLEQIGLGHWWIAPESEEGLVELLKRFGRVPLPCYIRKGRADEPDTERYQTVYASQYGAVAAPTAGLHFTADLFDRLRSRGIDAALVTLHVGLGTFQPIQAPDYKQHTMHSEWGQISAGAAGGIRACRERGGRVVAVGTSTARLLESAGRGGDMNSWSGDTDLYIYPPFDFRIVDVLITNFHLPHSTLLLLVSAFAGVDLLKRAYAIAIEQEYRFFSYGDAMFIV